MSGKVKANPGSGRICNLIMGVFWGGRAPIVQKIFAASSLYIHYYPLASAVDSDCSRTAPGHMAPAVAAASSFQTLLTADVAILGTLPVTNDVRVWARLLQVTADTDVDPFYHDGWSTRGASLAAMPPRALSYARRRAHTATQLRSVAEIAEVV